MNRDIIELREVVQKLVPLLAGKGLVVTQRGSQAYVTTNPRTKQPETVNIPNIPDNAKPEFIAAIQGFIDHEVAHVLHTDWNWYGGKGGMSEADLRNPKKRSFMNTHNIVEDVMIEREMCKTFPGSARNISATRKWFLENITDKALKGVKDPKEQFVYLLVPMMRALGGHEEMQDWMDAGNWWKNPLVDALLTTMKPATLDLLKHCTTTKETLEVAEEVHAIIMGKIAPPAPPPPPAPKPDPKEKKEKGKSEDKPEKEAGEGDGDGERDHKDKSDEKEKKPGTDGKDENDEGEGDEPDEEDDDDAGDAGKSSKGDEDDADAAEGEDAEGDDAGDDEEDADGDASGAGDDEDDPDGDLGDGKSSGAAADADEDSEGEAGSGGSFGAAGGGSDDGESEDDGADEEDEGRRNSVAPVTTAGADGGGVGDIDEGSDQETQGGGGGVGNGNAKSLFDYDDDDFDEVDMSSQIAIKISDEAVLAMDPSQYLVFTREMDRIEPVEPPSKMNPRWVPDMEDETRQMTSKLQKDIERIMASQSHVIRTPGHKSGKLHSPSLFRVTQGDPRVFTQKQEHQSKDTAVSIVIDNSGSMGGPKMKLAMIAGYALSATLDRVKISHEVIGFTTGGFFGMPESLRQAMADDAKKARISWDRTSPLVLPLYKTFDERLTATVKARFAYMMNAQPGLAGNVDGESLEYAAERLMKRTEKRKVMLVLSDGQPAGSHKAGPHLSYVVRQLGKMGIECIGIGIMDNAVSRFYPKYTVLKKAEDLPGQVMTEIKKILMG